MPEMNLAEESLGWLVLALGAVALGLGGLLAKRPPSAGRRAVVAGSLLGLAGLAWALSWQSSITLALAALAAFQTVRAVGRLSAARRAAARVGAVLASPLCHAVLLLTAGSALAVWQVVRLDRAAEAEMLESDQLLGSLLEPADLGLVPDRVALTDKSRSIPLFTSRTGDSASAAAEREQLRKMGLDLHLIQTANADQQYNCHGWVFTGGRYWVRGPAVETILKENGYKRVERPAANDLAVFRDEAGQVLHTAVVRLVTANGTVLLESKWGQLGRYLHKDNQHAYSSGRCTYYHSDRNGHLLRGLGYSQRQLAGGM
jgi:hypothetical protein